ncbi:MAG: hypothetical protein PHY93_21495 [Bacteriovorax sp.]|nr:hypothetical protein [Bacteriovorax sp.]
MKIMTSILFFIFGSLVFAGESGYILNGEVNVVYKDGKKVGTMPPQEKVRAPSSIGRSTSEYDFIYYQDDGNIRCYQSSIASQSTSLSCVQKK